MNSYNCQHPLEETLKAKFQNSRLYQKSLQDALTFIRNFPKDLNFPIMSGADDGEIVIEWKTTEHHLIISFSGDGIFEYTIYNGKEFVPGAEIGCINQTKIPKDILEYLEKIN